MRSIFSGLAISLLLLASQGALADGRPSGLRISNVFTERDGLVAIDVTVPYAGTNYFVQYLAPGQTGGPYTAFLGNQMSLGFPGTFQYQANQYTAPYTFTGTNVPRPYAIDWGDGNLVAGAVLTGPPNGPYTATFSHTYADPGDYIIRVADAVCCGTYTGFVTTGNVVSDNTRYVLDVVPGSPLTFNYYATSVIMSITDTTLVETLFQTAIPALNVPGLVALALLLSGMGVLLLRRRRVAR